MTLNFPPSIPKPAIDRRCPDGRRGKEKAREALSGLHSHSLCWLLTSTAALGTTARRIPIPTEHWWGLSLTERKAVLAVLVPSKWSAPPTMSDTISVGEIPGNIQFKSLLGQKQAGTGELHSQGPGRGWRQIAAVKGNTPQKRQNRDLNYMRTTHSTVASSVARHHRTSLSPNHGNF
ncbi:hypothetical protein Ddc_05723 [Ditylenchus destructor]|nr:hypothetical protein Ddc_05723 [Ditylenchus destructor]